MCVCVCVCVCVVVVLRCVCVCVCARACFVVVGLRYACQILVLATFKEEAIA